MTVNSRPLLFSEHISPRRHQLFDGSKKTLYEGPEPGTYVLYFKDDTRLHTETLAVNGKGILSNRISELLMSRLNNLGIENHFIRSLNMREQLVRTTEPLPFSVTFHNVAAGMFAKRLGLEEGAILPKPIPEFCLRSPDLNYPIVAAEHLTALGWGRMDEIEDILLASQRINDFLTGQFLALDIQLMSVALEFGRYYPCEFMEPHVLLIDEISPDTCDLLDLTTGKRLDRQGIFKNPGQADIIYKNIARRFGLLTSETRKTRSSPVPEGNQLKIINLQPVAENRK